MLALARRSLTTLPRTAALLRTPLRAMSSHPAYEHERRVAELAVQRACRLTDSVYHSHVKGTVTKEDKSPVTIADFGAQSVVIGAVLHAFPGDAVVGEEDADVLRQEQKTRDLVWGLVKKAAADTAALDTDIGTIKDENEMMDLIDRGNSAGGSQGRIWALDPVDGTKGFLRGGQYAVCLALMVDGRVVAGAIGCPNLPATPSAPDGEKGVLVSAVLGHGAVQKPLSADLLTAAGTPVKMNPVTDLSAASFCESVEAGHSSHGQQAAIAKALGIVKESVRMDSQAKYVSIARGDGDVYLRLPVSKSYEEKIWDHAAGTVIVEEAGGRVTDAVGNSLNFAVGRTLKENKGVVAAAKEVHGKVIQAVKEELAKASL